MFTTTTFEIHHKIQLLTMSRALPYPCPLQRMMEHFDEKYFQRWFCRPTRRSHLTEVFEELAMTYDLKKAIISTRKWLHYFMCFQRSLLPLVRPSGSL